MTIYSFFSLLHDELLGYTFETPDVTFKQRKLHVRCTNTILTLFYSMGLG